MKNPSGALSDATRAVAIEPEWAKARYFHTILSPRKKLHLRLTRAAADRARVGEANLALGKLDDARRAFKVAVRLDPTNASYAASLASLETAGKGAGATAQDSSQTPSPTPSPKTNREPSPTRHRPPPPRPEPPTTRRLHRLWSPPPTRCEPR